MAIKVAIIGAGSVGFTRKLTRDLLLVPELQDTHFALHDINEDNLGRIAQMLDRDIAANHLPATLTRSLDRREALDGADYVINCTRIGGLEAFKSDIEIPLKYGIDQCVGDTICAGGILYGQRNIPQILDFCKDMREVAADDVLFLNYANPMAINTWACLDHGGVETVGLCHGVEGGWMQIATVLMGSGDRRYGEGHRAWVREAKERVNIICAGINHQTWYTKVLFDGREVSAAELLEGFEKHERFSQTEKVRIDVLRRFGCYSTESNGHLSEYLPWYRKRPEEIRNWISLGTSWIDGETGGYLRHCTEDRGWFVTDFPKWLEEAGKPIDTWDRSSEHGSWIIEARETGRVYRGHFNVRNRGVIRNLPEDCVIEAPGFVDRFGISMVDGLELPAACAATCQASVNVQRMATEAGVRGDRLLLKQAVLHDPLTAAVCNPEEVWQMVDEMLVAQAEWLPQYVESGAVEEAKESLARHEREGTRVQARQWEGAARLKTRSVEELRGGNGKVAEAGAEQEAAAAK